MARSDPQINLRIPAELKERIEAEAAANNRSMNAEITARLLASLEEDEAMPAPDPRALEEAMAFAVGKILDRPGFIDKLADTMLHRKRKSGA